MEARGAVTEAPEPPTVVRARTAGIMVPAAPIKGRAAVIMATAGGIRAVLPATMGDIKADIMEATMADTNTTVTTAAMGKVTPTASGSAAGGQDGGDRLTRIQDIIRTILPIILTHIMPRGRL
jgi:hypothetical protein